LKPFQSQGSLPHPLSSYIDWWKRDNNPYSEKPPESLLPFLEYSVGPTLEAFLYYIMRKWGLEDGVFPFISKVRQGELGYGFPYPWRF
jgi:hypothetical protein